MWFSLFKKTLQKNVLLSQLVLACGRGLRWVQGAAGQVRHLCFYLARTGLEEVDLILQGLQLLNTYQNVFLSYII